MKICPGCGDPLEDMVDVCPHCDRWQPQTDSAATIHRRQWTIGAILALGVAAIGVVAAAVGQVAR